MAISIHHMKYVIVIFNIIFGIAGIGLIAIGSVLLKTLQSQVLDGVTDFAKDPPMVLVVTGCVICITTFLGSCGAYASRSGMLLLYCIVLFLLLITQVVIGVYALVMWTDEKINIEQELQRKFHGMSGFGTIERKFRCCGVIGSDSYADIKQEIPSTCCDGDCRQDLSNLFNQGCTSAIEDWLSYFGRIIGAVDIAFCVFEITGAILAFILSRQLKKLATPTEEDK